MSRPIFSATFVREGLLPNTLEELPKAADLVKEYRRLEAEVPVPQRAPGVIEAEARDRPLFVAVITNSRLKPYRADSLRRSMPSRLRPKTLVDWNWRRRCCIRTTR